MQPPDGFISWELRQCKVPKHGTWHAAMYDAAWRGLKLHVFGMPCMRSCMLNGNFPVAFRVIGRIISNKQAFAEIKSRLLYY
jgi:hypothetical protein